ncbi:hypothetical protein GQ43DRAFT_443276 [Delitschia confertaspora ATCC 74209]|uniref:Uncharacterized protein n=1 Tax=Delitschia confertaspora ATCC 74209 TaxID=1513339 RepID=A0A9P4JG55_9PLEO|nr:hypothetical protein GQ43DRAFT_443276 [Delitschia confertaspora ATCC 74209]
MSYKYRHLMSKNVSPLSFLMFLYRSRSLKIKTLFILCTFSVVVNIPTANYNAAVIA